MLEDKNVLHSNVMPLKRNRDPRMTPELLCLVPGLPDMEQRFLNPLREGPFPYSEEEISECTKAAE